MHPSWRVQIVDDGGLGRIVWEGPAKGPREAVTAAFGHVMGPDEVLYDTNRDGSRFETEADWDGSYVAVEWVDVR